MLRNADFLPIFYLSRGRMTPQVQKCFYSVLREKHTDLINRERTLLEVIFTTLKS